tara:strand:- start:332 stop:481 length:150 start_codon:yes stop_codon:yes gene_type:complete
MKTEKNKSSNEEIEKIVNTMLGAVIIVAGMAILLRFSKIMIGDFKDIGM